MTREEKIADKIIKELREEGLSYDQILNIIERAKKIFEYIKVKDIEVTYKEVHKQ